MIRFRIPPLSRRQNLGYNLAVLPPLFLHFVRHLLRNLLLLRIVVKDATPVLGAGIGALPILGGGIVHLVQKLNQRGIADLLRVEYDLQRLGVACPAGAHAAVRGVGGVAADVTNARVDQAGVGECFAVHVLDAPEAAGGDGGLLGAWWGVHGGNAAGGGELAQEAGYEGHQEGAEKEEDEKLFV